MDRRHPDRPARRAARVQPRRHLRLRASSQRGGLESGMLDYRPELTGLPGPRAVRIRLVSATRLMEISVPRQPNYGFDKRRRN